MELKIYKNYTVRVNYFNVKSNKSDYIEEKDVELSDIPKIIKAMIMSITVGGQVLDLQLIISSIEVKLHK